MHLVTTYLQLKSNFVKFFLVDYNVINYSLTGLFPAHALNLSFNNYFVSY